MVDREKVIKGVKCHLATHTPSLNCDDCPYGPSSIVCEEELGEDILELMKGQKTGHWTTKRTNEHDGEWYCDQCGHEPIVFENTPYCPSCGARMKQHVWNKAVKPTEM